MAAIVLGLTLVTAAAARRPPFALRDPVGDETGAAADIDALRVWTGHDRVVLQLSLADRHELGTDDLVVFVLDADADRTTGFPFFERRGIDAVVLVDRDTATLVELDGLLTVLDTLHEDAEARTITVKLEAGLVGPRAFAVSGVTTLRSDSTARDVTGLVRYVLVRPRAAVARLKRR